MGHIFVQKQHKPTHLLSSKAILQKSLTCTLNSTISRFLTQILGSKFSERLIVKNNVKTRPSLVHILFYKIECPPTANPVMMNDNQAEFETTAAEQKPKIPLKLAQMKNWR